MEMENSFRDPYVQLARYSFEHYIKTGTLASLPRWIPEEMLKRRAGVFVTLKKQGNLRGCIGTIEPREATLAEEIIKNAVSACAYDPRFPSVKKEEISQISCSVDVLSEAEPVENKEDLDVKKYGVIVSYGLRRGLLLPNLEEVTTVAEQIQIALKKAGITPDLPYVIERFQVVRHK